MAHPNAHPYPLSFPNELQISQISSYSSLANTLGTDSGYESRQQYTTKESIYLNAPPANNPSYPYPARNVINPGTYFARTPMSISNGRRPSDTSITQGQPSDQKRLHVFASRYDRLPQPIIMESDVLCGYQAGIEPLRIHFKRKGNQDPYSVWQLLTMNTSPDLVDGDSPILVENIERRIKVKLIWPGYSQYAFEKRIPIKEGAALTPALLLMTLAYHINEFARWIQNEHAAIEPGEEHWAIAGVPGGASTMWKNCVITSLQHRTGSTWQPEIFYPRA